MRLDNKIAIITGGGSGIGRAIAVAFAKEGAYVAICGRRKGILDETAGEIEEYGGTALACSADIISKEDINDFVENVLLRFGGIDILVNNAGVALGGDVVTTKDEDWDKVVFTDLKSVFLMSKAVIPHMLHKEKGKIINIGSIAGVVGFSASAVYCAAKGAVISLTKEMALDFAKNNIYVNAIAPGIIETDMTKAIRENEEMKKTFLAKIPIGRFGNPKDIAQTAVFLASNESDYITGQTIVVDGGWTIE